MKNYNAISKFTVAVNEINNNRALLPYILQKRMGEFAMKSIKNFHHFANSTPELFKINMLKNAYLNDVLKLKSKILLLNDSELRLLVEVCQRNNEKDVICKAHYKVDIKANTIGKAS